MNYTDSGKKDTRSGYGAALLELGAQDPRVVGLCADLTGSLVMTAFRDAYPDRFFQCGVAEANMMGVAAGLTIGGKIPFAATFANFATGRVYDQIRQSIAYSGKPVKICASHAGLTLGEDGATHQILEDIGLMKMLPGMTVIVPADYNQTRLATLALPHVAGPAYLRFGRPKVPNFTPSEDPTFRVGEAQILRAGSDVSLFACGHLVWEALRAAQTLDAEGISAEVINLHTLKPLDEGAIVATAAKTGAVVTCEEHNRHGGMGESVAQVLSLRHPTRQAYVAVDDRFGESGTPEQLMAKYGLTAEVIVQKARNLIAR